MVFICQKYLKLSYSLPDFSQMRQVPLERDINIVINGSFWVEAANPEHPFTAMLISLSRGTVLVGYSPIR